MCQFNFVSSAHCKHRWPTWFAKNKHFTCSAAFELKSNQNLWSFHLWPSDSRVTPALCRPPIASLADQLRHMWKLSWPSPRTLPNDFHSWFILLGQGLRQNICTILGAFGSLCQCLVYLNMAMLTRRPLCIPCNPNPLNAENISSSPGMGNWFKVSRSQPRGRSCGNCHVVGSVRAARVYCPR